MSIIDGPWRTRAPLSVLAILMMVVPATATSWQEPACARTSSVASVIVKGATQDELRYCVDLQPGATSLDALRATGLDITTRDFGELGQAVCKIAGEGNDVSDCPGGTGHWHFWNLTSGRWVEAEVGASARVVPDDGAVDGWTWSGPGQAKPPSEEAAKLPCATATPTPPVNREPLGWIVAGVGAAALLAIGTRARRRR